MRHREPGGDDDVERVDVDGLHGALSGRIRGTELSSSSVSLLETADVARDGPPPRCRHAGDVPVAGPPDEVSQRGLDVGPRKRSGERRALQSQLRRDRQRPHRVAGVVDRADDDPRADPLTETTMNAGVFRCIRAIGAGVGSTLHTPRPDPIASDPRRKARTMSLTYPDSWKFEGVGFGLPAHNSRLWSGLYL